MKQIFFYILIINSIVSVAQTPKIEIIKHIVPVEGKKKFNSRSSIISVDKDEIIIGDYKKESTVYTVYNTESFNKNGTFTILDPKVNDKKATLHSRLIHDEKITSIYSYYDKSEDENTFYGEIIDRENNVLVNSKILAQSSAKKASKVRHFKIYYSPKKSKILLIREPDSKRFENEKIEIVLYDLNLNKIYEEKIEVPYKYKTIEIKQIILTDKGDISIIAFWIPSKDELKKNPELEKQVHLKLFKVSEKDAILEEIEISEKGKFLHSSKGIITNDSLNEIVFFGFYGEPKEGTNKRSKYYINGVYYIKMDIDNWEIITSKFNLLEENVLIKLFVGNNTSSRSQKIAQSYVDNGAGITNMITKKIYYNSDGSISIINEIDYSVTYCNRDPRTGIENCHTDFFSNQIISFILDANGELKNTIIIPKQQISGSEYYLGSISLVHNNKLAFIYNDNNYNFIPSKINKKNKNNFSYTFGRSRQNRLAFVTYNKKGEIIKTPISENIKTNIMVQSRTYHSITESSGIVWGEFYNRRETTLLKISLED